MAGNRTTSEVDCGPRGDAFVSTAPAALHSSEPRWAQIAARLEALLRQPTDAQRTLADTLNVPLPDGLPAPVAAARLRAALNDALLERAATDAALPEVLNDIESELGITEPAQLTTYTRAEVSAWFQSRYMLMTARGLRALRRNPATSSRSTESGSRSAPSLASLRTDGSTSAVAAVAGQTPHHDGSGE